MALPELYFSVDIEANGPIQPAVDRRLGALAQLLAWQAAHPARSDAGRRERPLSGRSG